MASQRARVAVLANIPENENIALLGIQCEPEPSFRSVM